MIQEIKDRVSVRDLLDFLGVTVKGRLASCPLHPDRRPSFTFNENGLWYCFVCGVGGDVVTLVMKSQGLTFKDSLSWLNHTFSLGLSYRKPKPNPYLEALNANYKILKSSLKDEFNANCEAHYRRQWASGGLEYGGFWFWTAKDYTAELIYDEKQDLIESQLRELEHARFKLRREAQSAVNS